MCGRFANTESIERMANHFQVAVTPASEAWVPSWNVCPGTSVPVIIEAGTRRLGCMRWGWQRDWSQRDLINAQVEKVTTSPTWQTAYERRRCLVLATGWWEWREDPDGKFPYFHSVPNQSLLSLAGIYENNAGQGSVVVLTEPASEVAAQVHQRMPVVIGDADITQWFDTGFSGLATLDRSPVLSLRRSGPLRPGIGQPAWT